MKLLQKALPRLLYQLSFIYQFTKDFNLIDGTLNFIMFEILA